MTRLTNPLPIFLDADGTLLDGGYLYVGVASADPQSQPLQVYFDAAYTIPAAQPLRTLGGSIVNGATPTQVFLKEADFSLRVLDADRQLLRYDPTSFAAEADYQPLDDDLSAIAAGGTSDYGRGLLNLPNQAALRNATGIPTPLPIAGGAVTGNVTRQDAGGLAYAAAGTYQTVRLFGPENTTDPTQQPGDIWFKPRG